MTATTVDLVRIRAAVDDFLRASDGCADVWTAAPAPGKWSPSQLVEHVARSLEESARDAVGQRSKLPQLPAPARFLARQILFKRVLRNGRFPRARTNTAMDPESGPSTPADGRARLNRASEEFELAIQRVEGVATSKVFGTVQVSDYVRFQELHTRHHLAQLPRP
jgi:hypothetical protein